MKRILLLLITACYGTFHVLAQDLDAPLPKDPAVTMGTLENGLTYYIRPNPKPEKRVELRLALKAGSLQEDDDQLGLAHFIEHMAFNGTRNFEKQALIDYLESIGTRFGADLNATTWFENTTYKLMVPTDDSEILNKAFLIMQDWAEGIALDAEEIEKERGVVIEEWRQRRGAGARVGERQLPIIFHKSRYADRLPIGEVEILKTAPKEAFQRFYKEWYRPDLMAIVVVGDVEPAWAEAKIKEHFAGLKNPKKARERVKYPLGEHEETLFSIETDPELTNTNLTIYYKHPASVESTIGDLRQTLIYNLSMSMLNDRLYERTREEDPPYLSAYASYGSFIETANIFAKGVNMREESFERGLTALMVEMRRAAKFGFTQSELDRAIKNQLRRLEKAYDERDKTYSSRFVGSYVNHFYKGSPMPSIEQVLELNRKLLPTIRLDEINKASDAWERDSNRVFLVTGPEKEGYKLPTETEIMAMLDRAKQKTITAYEDKVSEAPLLAKKPKAGKVVEEQFIEALGVYDWKLSNGIRVILKPTDFKNDQILFTSSSPGGNSLVADADFIAAITAEPLISQSGLGSFDAIELEKKLAGKSISINASIGTLEEGFSGSASPKDVETMFQLLTLYVTSPRIDQTAFISTKTRWQAFVQNRAKNPNAVFSDALNKLLYKDHPRTQPFTMEILEQMDAENSLAIFKDRFADLGDSLFVFVGNFEPASFKPYIEQYIASLPNIGRKESWKDVGLDTVSGTHELKVHKGLEPKASVRLIFTGAAAWSGEQRHALTSLNKALDIRLREIMREDMGGVYGVNVSGSLSRYPKERFSTSISFTCDPANVEALTKAAMDEIERAQKEGFEDSYLDKVRESQLRSYELAVKQNGFWLSNLSYYYEYGMDPLKILAYPDKVKALNNQILIDAAKQYYKGENLINAQLLPSEALAKDAE